MAKIKEAIEEMTDTDERKRIEVILDPMDMDIIEDIQRRFGNCTTAAAIRACIRIAADVKLNLDRRIPINRG